MFRVKTCKTGSIYKRASVLHLQVFTLSMFTE